MRVLAFLIASVMSLAVLVSAQQTPLLSKQEQAIQQELRGLRSLPDDTRVDTTKHLASQIRQLPGGANKLILAMALSNYSTEGDFGRETLRAGDPGATEGCGSERPESARRRIRGIGSARTLRAHSDLIGRPRVYGSAGQDGFGRPDSTRS